jgi:hypothetical protein
MGIARVENEHAWQSGMWHHLPNMRALHASLQDLQAVMLTCSVLSPTNAKSLKPLAFFQATALLPNLQLSLCHLCSDMLIQNIQIAESPAENVWAKMGCTAVFSHDSNILQLHLPTESPRRGRHTVRQEFSA